MGQITVTPEVKSSAKEIRDAFIWKKWMGNKSIKQETWTKHSSEEKDGGTVDIKEDKEKYITTEELLTEITKIKEITRI